ncbi:hypothetical protein JXB02_05040 [Candidatus Woesearchaeota archaeon]|nr:hypothetical protein [Candidatus Woesearchaeota archaeon]
MSKKGRQIGKFTLTNKLGESMFSSVYMGVDQSSGKTHVFKFGNYMYHDRLMLEAMMMERIEDKIPVPRLIDFSSFGGEYFIEMPYIGPNLRVWVEQNKVYVPYENARLRRKMNDSKGVEPETVMSLGYVKVMRDIAQACHDAYREHSIIHGDLKPENILIRPRFETNPNILIFQSGSGVLADFGLADIVGEYEDGGYAYYDPLVHPAGRPPRIPKERTFVNREGYASPEVLLGAPKSAQSDIFSLGIVFYEMITGRKPLIIGKAPETSRVGFIWSRLPRIVQKMTHPEPMERYGSFESLLRELDTYTSTMETLLMMEQSLAGHLAIPKMFPNANVDPNVIEAASELIRYLDRTKGEIG